MISSELDGMAPALPIVGKEVFDIREADIQRARQEVWEGMDGYRSLAFDHGISGHQIDNLRQTAGDMEKLLVSWTESDQEIYRMLQGIFGRISDLERLDTDPYAIGKTILREFPDINKYGRLLNRLSGARGEQSKRPRQEWAERLAQKIFWEKGPGASRK